MFLPVGRVESLVNGEQQFAAEVLFLGLMAGHDATGGGDDGNTHAAEDAGDFLGADVLAAARLADAGDLGDGTAFAGAAELEPQDGLAFGGLVGDFFDFEDVALVFEDVGDVAAHARPGDADLAFGGAG